MSNKWMMDEKTFKLIRKVLPEGGTILELGSGEGTAELVKHYKVYSIEHDKAWLNKYHDNYIYAPIKKHKPVNKHLFSEHWYDPKVLKSILPQIDYDLIIVDGPPINFGRAGMLKYWDLFKHDVPVILDDLNLHRVYRIALGLASRLGSKSIIVYTDSKNFGIIPNGIRVPLDL